MDKVKIRTLGSIKINFDEIIEIEVSEKTLKKIQNDVHELKLNTEDDLEYYFLENEEVINSVQEKIIQKYPEGDFDFHDWNVQSKLDFIKPYKKTCCDDQKSKFCPECGKKLK